MKRHTEEELRTQKTVLDSALVSMSENMKEFIVTASAKNYAALNQSLLRYQAEQQKLREMRDDSRQADRQEEQNKKANQEYHKAAKFNVQDDTRKGGKGK